MVDWNFVSVRFCFGSHVNRLLVYIAKLRQRYYKTLKNILLHVSNHALKDMLMLNYGTIKKAVSIIVSSGC